MSCQSQKERRGQITDVMATHLLVDYHSYQHFKESINPYRPHPNTFCVSIVMDVYIMSLR